MSQYPRLVFHSSHDERSQWEMTYRGYVSHVYAEVRENVFYPIFFYDPIRFIQEFKRGMEMGRMFLAEPGMILVPEVTIAAMTAAIAGLYDEGYFDHLQSVQRAE